MKKILIVDDSPTIRHMIRASLQSLSSVEFEEAVSGLQAVEKFALAPAQLILLDMNMPDMHGLDVLRFLRAHESGREIPVVVLTTKSDEETRMACMAAGATLFMTKPFRPEHLAGQIDGLIQLQAAG